MKTLFIALRVALMTLLLCGVVYPLAVTGLSHALFADRAGGSMAAAENGRIVGSELIGQRFDRPGYFQPRPSAVDWDAANSGASNYGPTSKKLRDRVAAAVARLQKENPEAPADVPAELVTASASGLDPHLSPAGALWQAPRVARTRNVSPERIRNLIEANVEGRELGFLGEPRVNVLLLNLALDRQFGTLPRTETVHK